MYTQLLNIIIVKISRLQGLNECTYVYHCVCIVTSVPTRTPTPSSWSHSCFSILMTSLELVLF